MNIGNLLNNKQEEPAENFLAIQVEESLVQAAVWEIKGGQTKVLRYGPQKDWTDTESLLVGTDASLAQALEPYDFEPDRVIFGLPETWVDADKIHPDHQEHLKTLIEKLALKPIGFVVTTEAILEHIKRVEGIPPSIILLRLHASRIGLTVTQTGNIVGKQEVLRSTDLGSDVQEGLARLDLDNYPPRILILNGNDPEAEQQLLSFPWQDNLPFNHLPKVDILESHFALESIALSGGSEAAKSMGITVVPPKKETISEIDDEVTPPEPSGFVVDQDIQEIESPVEPKQSPDEPGPSPSKFKNLPKFSVSTFTSMLPKVDLSRAKKPVLIAIPAIFLLLTVGIVLGYGRISNAQITVFVTPEKIDTSLTLATESGDHDLPVLPAISETKSLETTGTRAVTGETLVGDPAKGEVTIYNKTDNERTIEAGTTITTDDNISFTLDSDITIASQSGDLADPFGKASVNVTADDIGSEGNLSNGTRFSVGTFPKSTLEAQANSDFSGGTSRTVKAVSANDRTALLDELTQKLEKQAEDEQASNSPDTQVLSVGFEVTNSNFSHAAGEEADTLELTLTGEVNLLRFNNQELTGIIEEELKDQIPSGYSVKLNPGELTLSPLEGESPTTTTVDIDTKLLPEVNTADYLDQIKGKSVHSASQLLETIPGYQKAQILISPNIPLLSTRLPNQVNSITFSLQPAE